MKTIHITSVNEFIDLLKSDKVDTVYMPMMLGSNNMRVQVERNELITEMEFNKTSDYHVSAIDMKFQLCNKQLVALDD